MQKVVKHPQSLSLDKAKKALILIHGRGGSADDMLPLGDDFVKNFYIAAPEAASNVWYPYGLMGADDQNEPYLTSSVQFIRSVINDIAKHIPKTNIYLMGFSQGASLSLETTARHAEPLGGVIAFAGGLIGKAVSPAKYSGDYQRTKIFIGLGDQDPYVPVARAEQSKKVLEQLGGDVTLQIYPGMGHLISPEEFQWVKNHILLGTEHRT